MEKDMGMTKKRKYKQQENALALLTRRKFYNLETIANAWTKNENCIAGNIFAGKL